MPVTSDLGHGQGGEVRAPMGVIVIGGLITSTILTLVVVPVIFTYMEALRKVPARIVGVFRRTGRALRGARGVALDWRRTPKYLDRVYVLS